jgi:hypothetical protein
MLAEFENQMSLFHYEQQFSVVQTLLQKIQYRMF